MAAAGRSLACSCHGAATLVCARSRLGAPARDAWTEGDEPGGVASPCYYRSAFGDSHAALDSGLGGLQTAGRVCVPLTTEVARDSSQMPPKHLMLIYSSVVNPTTRFSASFRDAWLNLAKTIRYSTRRYRRRTCPACSLTPQIITRRWSGRLLRPQTRL